MKKYATVEALEKAAQEFLKESFDLDLEIPIRINGRLKTTLGYFSHERTGEPVEIAISRNLVTSYTDDEILDTLKHECIHYALYVLNKPYLDGDKFFEETLRAFGVSSTQSSYYKGDMHIYKCEGCNSEYKRLRRLSAGSRCKCRRKGGRLNYLGTRFVDIEQEMKKAK